MQAIPGCEQPYITSRRAALYHAWISAVPQKKISKGCFKRHNMYRKEARRERSERFRRSRDYWPGLCPLKQPEIRASVLIQSKNSVKGRGLPHGKIQQTVLRHVFPDCSIYVMRQGPSSCPSKPNVSSSSFLTCMKPGPHVAASMSLSPNPAVETQEPVVPMYGVFLPLSLSTRT